MISRFPEAGRFCVLDIETAPAEEVIALSRGGGSGGGRAALQAVVAACVMTFSRGEDGCFSGVGLRTFDTAAMDEADLILGLDAVLAPVCRAGGGMVTFNGLAHDIPALQRRAARHWLFGALQISPWVGAPGGAHLDLMVEGVGVARRRGGRPPSLVDACAAFGIDAHGPGTLAGRARGVAERAETDVVATFLLHLYWLARREGSAAPLAAGWIAFAEWFAARRRKPEHLMGFARHEFLGLARRLRRAGADPG